MTFAQSQSRPAQTGSRVTRLAVALYWSLGIVFGLLRLSRVGWQGPEVGQVLNSWYIEALLFLGAWGGAACVMGLLTGSRGDPKRRGRKRRPKRTNRVRSDTLAGLERQRGR